MFLRSLICLLTSAFILSGCLHNVKATAPGKTVPSEPVPTSTKVPSKVKAPSGHFSMDNYMWNYAPWVKTFRQELHKAWVAPYSYTSLAMVSGFTSIKITVEKDGHFSEIKIIDKEGHESLHRASLDAVEALDGLTPLPDDFSENRLIFKVLLKYPELRENRFLLKD